MEKMDHEFEKNYFRSNKRTEKEISQILDNFLGLGWRHFNPGEMLRKAAKILKIDIKVKEGIGNDEVPEYQANKNHIVCLVISEEDTPCGDLQSLFFFLDQLATRSIINKIDNGPYLFEVGKDGTITSVYNVDEKRDTYKKMKDYPILYQNAKILWDMLKTG